MSTPCTSLPPRPTPVAVPPEPAPWARESRNPVPQQRADHQRHSSFAAHSDDRTDEWPEYLQAG